MATGVSGSNSAASTINGYPISEMQVVDLRVIQSLLQSLLGTNQATDDLETLRNDEAFAMGLSVPVPGQT
jgi:hypothetical protein